MVFRHQNNKYLNWLVFLARVTPQLNPKTRTAKPHFSHEVESACERGQKPIDPCAVALYTPRVYKAMARVNPCPKIFGFNDNRDGAQQQGKIA
jgi:hypothetical protein